MDKVVGSMDRYEDFDHTFLPKTPRTLERWKRLRALQLSGVLDTTVVGFLPLSTGG